MADWDGLRSDLERGIDMPPFAALRERRRRRQQRRAVAAALSITLVGGAAGLTALGHRESPSPEAARQSEARVALGDRVPPKGDYKTYVVTDVDFVSADTGWALGLRCVGDACDVATWRTDDGGRSWGPETPVARHVPRESFTEQDPSGGAVRSLRMVDAREGFAFNPDLYVTHDGAKTWTRVPQPTKVASLGVQDGSVWLLERGCAVDDDCDAVLRTAKVGATFAPVTTAIPATGGADAIVRRADAKHGYLVTWNGPQDPVAALYRTADGGTTWQPATNPCAGAGGISMSAGRDLPLLMVCTSQRGRTAYTSTDATAWRRLADPPAAGTVTDLVTVAPGIAYLSTLQPARIYVTTNGGSTWSTARDTNVKAYGFANLDATDPAHVWAMGDAGRLWRTTNGTRWERLPLPPGAPRATALPQVPLPVDAGVTFTGLSFADARHGWAIGHSCVAQRCTAVLRRTSDGGRTWQRSPAPAGWRTDADALLSVRFAGDRGWAYFPGLATTTDGGAHWRTAHSGTFAVVPRGEHLWTMQFDCSNRPCHTSVARDGTDVAAPAFGTATFAAPDDQHAYLLDDGTVPSANSGKVAATADGGAHWTTYAGPCPSATSRTLRAWGPDRLWAGCSGSDGRDAFAQSDDGGAHWHTVLASLPRAIADLLVPLSATDALLVLERAPMQVTHDGGRTWSGVPLASPYVSDVTFLSPTQGWALGSDGVVYATTDGETWERLARP